MKKLLLAVILFLAITASPLLAQVAGKSFINGIDANFPPFAFMGPDGQATGFDVEAVNWIAQKKGFTVKHQPMEWDSIVTSLKDKKIDLIASGMSITPERSSQVAFTNPYWQVRQVALVRKDSTLTLEEVLTTGQKIGVQQGTSEAKNMADTNNRDGRRYELASYGSGQLAASDVVNGRIAAVVLNDTIAADVMKHLALKNLGEPGIPSEQFGYAVNKENPELLKVLNEGLELLKKDPFWQVLIDKYKPGEH
ncbi:MAG: ABC transporter substrate-binding protein [Deltaproteobacteria bacterium]|jgi:polar amino acid transport system substrate-binding protein|nr:ABC transporter substrate-binding protein [Deltaproteobacteria bacterium]